MDKVRSIVMVESLSDVKVTNCSSPDALPVQRYHPFNRRASRIPEYTSNRFLQRAQCNVRHLNGSLEG